MGIRVEVASFFRSTARQLALRCSGHVDLDRYCREWQGAAASSAPPLQQESVENSAAKAAHVENRMDTVPEARLYQNRSQS